MKKFPKVTRQCRGESGLTCYSGKVDMSYHGSPVWETCPKCEGSCQYEDTMTTDEKLNYLLSKVKET